MRFNGIGTTLLGVSKMDQDHIATATLWFTFLFFPIIPLRRYRVQFTPSDGAGCSFYVLEDGRPIAREVLKTYFGGWIVAPLLIFAPLAFAIRENWETFNLPEAWYTPFVFFSIAWFAVTFIVILTRLENRCKPPKGPSKYKPADSTLILDPKMRGYSFTSPKDETASEKPVESPPASEAQAEPGVQGSPWGAVLFILVLVGSVAAALYMVIAQVGPVVPLIEFQVRVFGGYSILYTFLAVWVVLIILAAIVAGLLSSLADLLKRIQH